LMRDGDLEDRFCEIDGDGRMLHVGSSLPWPRKAVLPLAHDAARQEESIPSLAPDDRRALDVRPRVSANVSPLRQDRIEYTQMQHRDFYIGLEFYTGAGRWRCTDVGTRVIVAIRLDASDPSWYNGPRTPWANQFSTRTTCKVARSTRIRCRRRHSRFKLRKSGTYIA
jgi:hypothetical protein